MLSFLLVTFNFFLRFLIKFTYGFQIVHWKNHLRFPEDAKISPEAKDLVCRLLCDVEHRLGTGGAAQIKV